MKGDMQRSIALMRQSVELFPSSASYWYDLAVTYLQAKQYPEAKQAALKAIQIDPNYAPAQKIVADLQKY
jgi:tetratricopeptide (TPR) repeat protein